MDLREKINHPLYFPAQKIKDRRSLTQVIMDAVNEGSLTAYRGDDEEFTTVMTKAEIDGIMSRTDTLFVDDPDNPGNQIMKIATNEFDPSEALCNRPELLQRWKDHLGQGNPCSLRCLLGNLAPQEPLGWQLQVTGRLPPL
jgi:hypothetical protein